MTSEKIVKINMIQKRLIFYNQLFRKNYKFYCMEPEPPGADPIWPESAPGPETFRAEAPKKVAAPPH